MRNDSSEKPLEKNLNRHIKSFVKPSQPCGNDRILSKIIDIGTYKKEQISNLVSKEQPELETKKIPQLRKVNQYEFKNYVSLKKDKLKDIQKPLEYDQKTDRSLNDYQKSFFYAENIQSDIKQNRLNIDISKNVLNKVTNVKNSVQNNNGENHKLPDIMECADSRVTGGGSQTNRNEDFKCKLKHNEIYSPNELSPIKKKENNPSRKISFKIRHPTSVHRKNSNNGKTVTTLKSSKVAALTQKFNDLIKDNDSLLKEPRFAKVIDKIQNTISSNNSTPTSTLTSGINVKIITNNKVKRRTSLKSKSPSNSSLDKLCISDSPNIHQKLSRVRSDVTPRKKNVTKKKDIYKKIDFTNREKITSVTSTDKKEIKNIDVMDIYETRRLKNNVKRKPSFKSSPTRHSVDVRATIQKFELSKPLVTNKNTDHISSCNIQTGDSTNIRNNEHRILINVETSVPISKPKVPEKKVHLLKTKNIVVRDGIAKIKLSKPEPSENKTIENNLINEVQNRCDDKNSSSIADIPECDIKKIAKKEFFYDKMKFRQSFLHQNKLQLPHKSSEVCFVDSIPETDSNYNKEQNVSNQLIIDENKSNEETSDYEIKCLTDDEKLYQEVSARIKPNESFLWRSNSKIDILPYKEYEIKDIDVQHDSENIYDFVGSPGSPPECDNKDKRISSEDIICPSFDTFIKKADDLLDSKKREIAEDLKKEKCIFQENFNEAINLNVKQSTENFADVFEAINSLTVSNYNLEKEISQMDEDEGYEPLEPYRNDIQLNLHDIQDINKPHSKTNCPLPEVPLDKGDDHYQCLFESRSHNEDETLSIHSYEYCPCKIKEEKCSDSGSDGGYEYCKSPKESVTSVNKSTCPIPVENIETVKDSYQILKKSSPTSSVGYDKLSSIYESIPPKSPTLYHRIPKFGCNDMNYGENGINYDDCNCDENIYDTIKQPDTISVSNCYESIPGSPHSVIRMRQKVNNKFHPHLLSRNGIPYDAISNFSQSCSISTISSENKTNSIYGQRSIISYERSETLVYGQASSEVSSSDRSDDWVDISDQDESTDPTIIIIREKARVKRSPASWSRKVRHQWNKTPKKSDMSDTDSSDREHLYESLSHPPRTVDVRTGTGTAPYADDFDSFDSDSETEDRSFHHVQKNDIDINNAQLPEPPTSSNIYTLTRFASAAGKKMRQLKSFTTFTKSTRKKSTGEAAKCNLGTENKDSKQVPDKKNKKQTFKEGNKSLPDIPSQNLNTSFSRLDENNTEKLRVGKDSPNIKQPSPLRENLGFQFPSKNSLYNNTTSPSVVKRNLATEDETVSPDSNKNAKASPTNNGKEKDSGTLSRKSYLSFKSKFKRNTSLIETNPTRSLSLSVTKSTFYLNDLNDSAVHKSEPQLTYESNKDEPPPLPASKKMTNNSSQDLQATDLGVKSNSESSIDVNSNKTSPVNETRSIAPSKFVKNRPAGPPPPPPLESNHINTDLKKQQSNKKDKRTLSTTSWYAECGLFKASEPYKPESNGQVKERKSSASWYSEVGLYQVGNISTSSGASSTLSGGGTCSTTTAPSPPDTPVPPLGMFNQEPLYQFYNAAKLESVCRDIGKDSDMESDVYEEVANFKEGSNGKIVQRPSAMALINPQKGPSRTLWCEIPEVINSAILGSLAPTQKKLQEAMFEIITSEASYLNSLTVLESHFMQHPAFKDDKILSESDGNILFGNVIPVKKCSEQLMADLEQCWQDNILLRGLCKIVKKHAEKNFHVYVKYCEYQVYIIKTLKKLKTDDKFNEVLLQIQSQPACHSLSLHSFLMLPMQRVTRLPLLMDAVLKNLDASEDEYQSCLDALAILNNIVFQCNEGARNMERVEEMAQLSSKFEFPPYVKEVPIILPKSDHKIIDKPQRWLVKSGELTQLVWRGDDQSKLTFGKKYNKISLHLFLFTDLLVITKKKSEDSFIVVDYCKRSLLEITSSDMMGQSPVKETAGRHVLLLTMLENCENKTIEMLLSCVSESDRQRWIEACLPPPSDNPNETIYEGWDCPQVAAIYPYQSTQPDELNLQQGDIVNVSKKMADGWYHGERIRDGEKGWFPGNYTIEIASQHVRAKNLRQRYRLLALTGSYLEKNKKK